MKISCIQTYQAFAAWDANVDAACVQARREIDRTQPDLVLLPEAFPGYVSSEMPPRAEPIAGPTLERMQELADRGSCLVLFGMLRQAEDGLYNSAILTDASDVLGVYDKTHLYHAPSLPPVHEQSFLVPGATLGLFDTAFGRLGVMICHDGCYPELPRALALRGADMICWLMNNGTAVYLAKEYARLCMLPVAMANPYGPNFEITTEKGHQPVGGSFVANGDGQLLAEAPLEETAEISAELDLVHWRPQRASGEGMQALYRVRRTDLYGPLAEPYAPAEPLA